MPARRATRASPSSRSGRNSRRNCSDTDSARLEKLRALEILADVFCPLTHTPHTPTVSAPLDNSAEVPCASGYRASRRSLSVFSLWVRSSPRNPRRRRRSQRRSARLLARRTGRCQNVTLLRKHRYELRAGGDRDRRRVSSRRGRTRCWLRGDCSAVPHSAEFCTPGNQNRSEIGHFRLRVGALNLRVEGSIPSRLTSFLPINPDSFRDHADRGGSTLPGSG